MVSKREVMAATDHHRRALEYRAFDYVEEGVFSGWQWWRGADRVVWRPPDGDTVYKIQIAESGMSNELEHENMSKWRAKGFEWAPRTQLYPSELMLSTFVLAMPYYSIPISSPDEIPDCIHRAGVPDLSITNFRRRPGGPVMLIDAGDIVPH